MYEEGWSGGMLRRTHNLSLSIAFEEGEIDANLRLKGRSVTFF